MSNSVNPAMNTPIPSINLTRVKFIAFKTIVINEMKRFFRIWPQSLLPSVITMALYFLIFGSFIGSQVGSIQGVTYMQFITPGLIMMSVITNAYANVVSSFYTIRFQRSVEELLIAPVPNWLILTGYISGGILRGLIVGFLVTLVALFFTHIDVHHIIITLTVVLLTALLFSLAGFTNALFAKKFDDISIISTFVLTPLTYMGGVFFSITQLSSFWRHISQFNPILYMVNGLRYGILGITDLNVGFDILFIACFVIALFTLNILLLRKGVGIRT